MGIKWSRFNTVKALEMGKQLLLVNGATGRTVLKDSDHMPRRMDPRR